MAVLALACAISPAALAQDKDPYRKEGAREKPPAADLVVVDLRLIEMTEQAAEGLFRGGLARVFTVDEATLAALRVMLTNGTARTAGRMRLATLSGQNAEVKGIAECRYASDYEEMGATIPAAPAGTNAAAPVRVPGGQAVKPAAFETRDVGVILNLTSVVAGDGETIHLTMLPQTVQCPFFRDIQAAGPGGEVRVNQPEFRVMTTAASVTVRPGDTVLLSAVTPPGNEGDAIVLFLMTASLAGGKK
jgi:hypothetical protein